MDIANLSSIVSTFLRSFLPYLIREEEPVFKEAAGEIDAVTWELVKAIWDKVSPKIEDRPAIKESTIKNSP